MTVGDRIRFTRLNHDVTQQELADCIGVSKQAIYKYENNIVTNIPTDKVSAIAKRLNVTPAYLMGWEDTPAPTPSPLTPQQAELLSSFDQLNEEGKQKTIDYASDLVLSGRYKKHPALSVDSAKEA